MYRLEAGQNPRERARAGKRERPRKRYFLFPVRLGAGLREVLPRFPVTQPLLDNKLSEVHRGERRFLQSDSLIQPLNQLILEALFAIRG